jgi:anti-sigma B factor antagonist
MESVSKMQITRSERDAELLLHVAGALDAYTAPDLRAELDAVLAADAPPSTLVLDLGGLGFLDSTGLRVLVETHSALAARHGTLRLRNATATTRRLLDITGLSEVLVVEDLGEGVEGAP